MARAAHTQRFRSTIQAQGLPRYVDVPARVSRAFARFARAGRIQVEGTANGVEFRGALVPAGNGRHRLFLRASARGPAGVDTGDAVNLVLRALPPGAVAVPDDLAAALRGAGLAQAFAKLTPSQRREMVRWIDETATPSTRKKRIDDTLALVRGERVPSQRRDTARPLWTCQKCGRQFVNRNNYHSCRRWTLDDTFRGKPDSVRELFDAFRVLVEACGPVIMLPYRDKIGFMARVRFCGAVPRQNALDVGFWLPRRLDHPRFHKVETITPAAHVHLLRIETEGQLDAQVRRWLREAYAVGCQEHVR